MERRTRVDHANDKQNLEHAASAIEPPLHAVGTGGSKQTCQDLERPHTHREIRLASSTVKTSRMPVPDAISASVARARLASGYAMSSRQVVARSCCREADACAGMHYVCNQQDKIGTTYQPSCRMNNRLDILHSAC